MSDDPLRVGLLLDGDTVQAWVGRALERMVAEADAEITHLVVNVDQPSFGLDHYLDRVREYPLWTPVGAIQKLTDPPAYKRQVPVADVPGAAEAERVTCEPEPASDFGNVLPDDVVERVGPEIDVAVRIGFGILKGEILDTPEHGVLSFHHGDLRRYRGMPAGFWEFVNDESVAGVTLQRITETLDGGSIVAYRDVDVADAHTWQELERRLFRTSEGMLAEGVENLQDPDFEPWQPDSYGDLYSLPKGRAVLKYVAKNNVGRVRERLG